MNPIDYWYKKYMEEKLTWKDIDTILQIDRDYSHELMISGDIPTYEEQCKEILKRYQEHKTLMAINNIQEMFEK